MKKYYSIKKLTEYKDQLLSVNDIKILELDDNPIQTFIDINEYIEDEPDITNFNCFLYHGIRFQQRLEKLEDIFKKKKLLAGKYLDDYRNYSDNCNEGEYVSLFGGEVLTSHEYDVFVKPNVSLVISPFCGAYKTIYVPYDTWCYIRDKKLQLNNRFSYMYNEYQIKNFVPLEMVRAIGIPYSLLTRTKNKEEAELLKRDVIDLMDQYSISLPIVDTSNINRFLYNPQDEKEYKHY